MLVSLPKVPAVDVLVIVTVSRLLLNCVMFAVAVTPVFMPVKVKASARALALAKDNVISAPSAKIAFDKNLFISFVSSSRIRTFLFRNLSVWPSLLRCTERATRNQKRQKTLLLPEVNYQDLPKKLLNCF